MTNRVKIKKLSTGIPGLDTVLGGGIPELSFNLIAGGPGCGKTTFAHQFVFANASEERKAIYFTIFGEPPVKMLRYQQQFDFFDASKIGTAIRFVHLGKEMLEGGLARVLERIKTELEETDARTIIVDSFRSVARSGRGDEGRGDQLGLENFVQLLAFALTSFQATTFLVGEYQEHETESNPVFTVADGILWLYQTVSRNSTVRRAQVVKMRGQSTLAGLHFLKMTDAGLRVYPRLPKAPDTETAPATSVTAATAARLKTGVDGLDEMLGGGIPAGYSVLLIGPSGSGKTTLGTQFVLEGARADEASVVALFEKRPEDYLRTSSLRADLERLIADKKLALSYIRPLDLSVDEAFEELHEAVVRLGAKRVVIDSLSGFELALAPAFRDDFRESLNRMVGSLTSLGVTVLLAVEVTDSYDELRLSPNGASFLSDGLILQRYVEIEGSLRKVMTVIKLRGSAHSNAVREYRIDERGYVIGEPLKEYRGVLRGTALRRRRKASK